MASAADDAAEQAARRLKGLSEAKLRVDQVVLDDSKYPDLLDQLATQSEPQNYFLEPYASQWCPQLVKKGALIALPSVIASALEDELSTLTLSGLLPALGHAWTSVDHRLFLWSYRHRGRFVVFEMDQPIVAVGLCVTPRAGVFTDKVRHLLVVATTVEVVLVAVLYENEEQAGASQRATGSAGDVTGDGAMAPPTGGLRLQRTKLSISTDHTVVRSIVTTAAPHSRVFFAGSDGGVYEFVYGPSSGSSGGGASSALGFDPSLFIPSFLQRGRDCRKVTHTSRVADYLPRFLSALTTSAGKVLSLTVDTARYVLYALHDQGDVDVFDLGPTGNDMKLVCTLNLLMAGARYARENRRTRVSCPDERIFQPSATASSSSVATQIVALDVVDRHESSLVSLVAVTTNGIRFYLTAYSRRAAAASASSSSSGVVRQRPTRLEVLSIRLPPPAVTLADAPPYHAKEGMQPGFAPGKSPSHVHRAFYQHGVLLLVDGGRDEQDRLVGITHDPIAATSSMSTAPTSLVMGARAGKPTLREAVALESCVGKIVDVQELHEPDSEAESFELQRRQRQRQRGAKRSFDAMVTGYQRYQNGSNGTLLGGDAIAMVGEIAQQYSEPSRHFLCLSSAGIQVFKKIRPIDQLHRALLLARGSDGGGGGGALAATLAPFVRSFGEIQVCCMLLALACGVASDPLVSDGTVLGGSGSAARAAATSRVHRAGVKSDDYIFTTALQGIFECGQFTVSRNGGVDPNVATSLNGGLASTRIVLTTDFGMSFQHDALVMFLCRVLRPLWFVKRLGRRVTVSNSEMVYALTHSPSKLDEIREVLFQLRQLMETAGPFAVSIRSGGMAVDGTAMDLSGDDSEVDAATRVAQLANRYEKQRTEEQLTRERRFQAEQRSLYFLYQLVLRSIEAISLLRFTIDYHVPLDESLASLSFGDIVASSEGIAAAKGMIKSILKGRNENNQFLVQQLREQCPSYFSVSDLWHYQGYKSLALAKLSAPSAGRAAHLRDSLTQFLSACHMWNTGDCVDVLHGICEDYSLLHFYEGVVKLTLACAQHFEVAAASDMSGLTHMWKRNCLGCILLVLQRLLGSESADAASGVSPTLGNTESINGRSPQAVEDMVSLDDESRKRYTDEVFQFTLASEDVDVHELVYAWLYEHGHTRLLIGIRSAFIEDFLKARDQDLLIKMYMEQRKYLVAAKVWWARAHEDVTAEDGMTDLEGDDGVDMGALVRNPDLLKRQFYVSKALGCLKSVEDVAEAADAIREVRDVLDVLQLQVRVLKALEQAAVELEASSGSGTSNASSSFMMASSVNAELTIRKRDLALLTYKIFDATTLYNQFASKYDMWSECLHIIHSCNSEEADVIEGLWRKIILDMVPPAVSSPSSGVASEFNSWRLEQCEIAGLQPAPMSNSPSAAFESGFWIGQMQSKILRLGKALYTSDDSDSSAGYSGAFSGDHRQGTPIEGSFVFPVNFLALTLERVSYWYLRVTQQPTFAMAGATSSVDATTLHWVLQMFLDVGVSHRVLLSQYERLYHAQGTLAWTLHLLQSIHAILTRWKKHAVSPRAGKDELADYAASCPHLVAMCDDMTTDLMALASDGQREVVVLLEQFRRYKNELMSFRSSA